MIYRPSSHRAGFTLTEMAIVLGVVGILVAGLWNLIAGANQQARDESAASQQGQLITAVKAYLFSADGQNFMTANNGCGGNCGASVNFALPLPTAAHPAGTVGCISDGALTGAMNDPTNGLSERTTWCNLLPPGFSQGTINSYGQQYWIRVLRDATASGPPNSYSFMVATTGGTLVPDTSGSRIAALIGGDGGFIYTNTVCLAPASATACGSYGGWTATVGAGGYGFTIAPVPTSGSIASRSYVTPQLNALTDWLARVNMPGDTTHILNTMSLGTNAYIGGNELEMGSYGSPTLPLIGGGTLNMQNGTINFDVPGVTTGGGSMNAQGGTINMQAGPIYLQGGILTNNAASSPDGSAIIINGNGTYATLGNAPPAPLIVGSGGCFQTWPPTQGTLANNVPANGPNYGPPFCQDALQVNGDANISGTLSANGLYAGTFIYQSSDIRLKTNIKPIENPLENIMRLKPVSFTLKASGKDGLGVIAQDIEKVYPQLVSNGVTKSVNYDGLIGPLIGAVQQLEKENIELRKQIDEQSLRQQKLENEINSR